MSGIQKFITKLCVQPAVYWTNPVNDGQGGKTFDTPYEINCRWEDISEVVSDSFGKSIVCRAKVLVTQELVEEGYLYLGTIASVLVLVASDSTKVLTNPLTFDTAYEIKRVVKVPEIFSTVNFVHTVFL